MMKTKYIVINGSRKGLSGFAKLKNKIPELPGYLYVSDVPESVLYGMKRTIPNVRSYYLYDSKDLVGKTIHDIGPTIVLYDTFIKVDTGSDNKD